MRGSILVIIGLALTMAGCANSKFVDASGGVAAGKTLGNNGTDGAGGIPVAGGADGVGGIPTDNDDDGVGGIPVEDNDPAFAAIPITEFFDIIKKDPVRTQSIMKDIRCYISHSGGHGIELCMTGDKSQLLKLWPMEVKGNAICAPASTVTSRPELFAGAMVGPCM